MALTYDQISAITEKKFMPKVVDNIFDSNPLLQRAKDKFYQSVNGGTSIMVPLNYAQSSSVEWYSGADTLLTADNDVITSAEYQWKQIHAAITLSGLDQLKNNGDAAKVNFVKSKTQIAEKSLMDTVGTGLYSNGSTLPKSIGGLRLIVSASNTVGGISQSTYTWWGAQINSSTTTLSLAAMQTLFNLCSIGNDAPSVIVATRSIYNFYYALLQPQQRFVDSETAKGGFQSLMFNGVPVIVDSHVPSGYMFMVNEDYLSLCYHPDRNFKFQKFNEPINQDVSVGHIFWAGNLTSSNNRMHGAFTALTA